MQLSTIRKVGKLKQQEMIWGYAMIAPIILFLAVFFYISLVASFAISFTDWEIIAKGKFVGLSNFLFVLSDKDFLRALWNTARFVLISIPIGQTLAFIIALVLNEKIYFRNFFRLIYFLPVLTMTVAIAVVWKWIYHPLFGPLAGLINALGLPTMNWLTDVNLAMVSLAIVAIWQGIGYQMIIMLAGLQSIPRELYEAARVDGASKLAQIQFITIPLMTPTLFFTVITSFIGGLQMFDLAFMMTEGGPMKSTYTGVYYVYNEGIYALRAGLASAASWVIFIIILAITIFQLKFQRKWVHYDN